MRDTTQTRAPFLSTDTPKQLKDMKGKNSGVTTSQINISAGGTIIDVDVRMDITHSFDSDLKVELLPPQWPSEHAV